MLAQGSQSHLHLALAASSPGLAQLWWGKRKLRVAQLGEGGLRRWQEQWGGGAQFLPEMPETSSQLIHWTGAAGEEWPGC